MSPLSTPHVCLLLPTFAALQAVVLMFFPWDNLVLVPSVLILLFGPAVFSSSLYMCAYPTEHLHWLLERLHSDQLGECSLDQSTTRGRGFLSIYASSPLAQRVHFPFHLRLKIAFPWPKTSGHSRVEQTSTRVKAKSKMAQCRAKQTRQSSKTEQSCLVREVSGPGTTSPQGCPTVKLCCFILEL